ncbi:hypothetical protein [Bacillus thuringiensis]|nr:hypothetical protein [Bacillus thuringiensis]
MLIYLKVSERMAYSKAQNEATKNYKKRNPEQANIKLWLEVSSRI